jgi:hypothetical protein
MRGQDATVARGCSPNDIDLDADGSCCFQVAGDSFGIFVVGIDQQSKRLR